MCFLYRQSISIVYESKFKYIYRYFIKIDRCFCGILQSLPLRKCGLKYIYHRKGRKRNESLPLRKRINELSYGLEDISGEKVVSFNLELRSPDMNKIDAEIKRLGKILLNN